MRFNSYAEARAAFLEDAPRLAALGIINDAGASSYMWGDVKRDVNIALDAAPTPYLSQPPLTTAPNSSVPSFLTQFWDPEAVRVRFAANKAAKILGEVKKGDWTTDTAIFQMVEHDGEVSSYDDYADNGHSGANTNYPQRQSYHYQVIIEYGERELARQGLARLNWVAEQDAAAAMVMAKFENLTYFFGVVGLQNYGLLNDPNLNASLTPATKASGGTAWTNASGAVTASANEVFNDIQSLFAGVVATSDGLVEAEDAMTLALSTASSVALTATNAFNVNVHDLLKKNFPNLKVETAVQYGKSSTQNSQGLAAGNAAQLIVDRIEGQKTGDCAFTEKMRAHPIIRGTSSFKQKKTGGTWGSVIKQPFAIATMIGL